jgi:hypothetical protein
MARVPHLDNAAERGHHVVRRQRHDLREKRPQLLARHNV